MPVSPMHTKEGNKVRITCSVKHSNSKTVRIFLCSPYGNKIQVQRAKDALKTQPENSMPT